MREVPLYPHASNWRLAIQTASTSDRLMAIQQACNLIGKESQFNHFLAMKFTARMFYYYQHRSC